MADEIKEVSIEDLKSRKNSLVASSNYLSGLISDIQENKDMLDKDIEKINKMISEKESAATTKRIIGFGDRF